MLSTTLDTLTSGIDKIALIKMDLEGAESQALAGAEETLKRTNAIIFESWTGHTCETSRILSDAGFTFDEIDGRNFRAVRNPTEN